jgi:hypothetical protein
MVLARHNCSNNTIKIKNKQTLLFKNNWDFMNFPIFQLFSLSQLPHKFG